jgi:ReqiPepy6 Gp37-like protein
MEIYILDALLRPIDVLDEYISFIWTERYAERGDFQLVTRSTIQNRNRFVKDALISIDDSNRIMRVNSTEEKIDSDNGVTFTVKGLELVSILDQRVVATREPSGDYAGMVRPVTYYEDKTPLQLPGYMVWQMCYPASGFQLSAGDAIPFLQDSRVPGSGIYPLGNIPPMQAAAVVWEQKTQSLYSAAVDVANAYDVGFRLYKDPNAAKLYFEAYMGNDRTSAQTLLPAVVFSTDMSNLQNTTEYIDNSLHYNVILAVYEYANPVTDALPAKLTISVIVSDPELAFSAGGFDQKTKTISVTSLPEGMLPAEIPAYLTQLAAEELTRSRPTDIYDGEVTESSYYKYERDYFLGDLVEVRGDNGGAAYMRVEEQIIKADANGKSSYPSLVTKTSISPGTWKSWKYDVDWIDMGSGEFWNNQ